MSEHGLFIPALSLHLRVLPLASGLREQLYPESLVPLPASLPPEHRSTIPFLKGVVSLGVLQHLVHLGQNIVWLLRALSNLGVPQIVVQVELVFSDERGVEGG